MQKRSREEVEQLLRGYEESGLRRQEYCQQAGIPVTTFDYYRQREARKAAAGKRAAAKLVKVKVEGSAEQARSVFTLVLGNGRRIETGWNFADAELSRLIRIVEGV
jgi:hypothetical protein